MGGRRQCSLWVGAAFTLLFACGNETSPAGSTSSEGTDSTSADSTKADPSSPAASSGNAGSAAANGTKPAGSKDPVKKDEPLGEQTEFFSADIGSTAFDGSRGALNGGVATSGSAGSASTPTTTAPVPGLPPGTAPAQGEKDASTGAQSSVQRGDIYRVLSDKRILNLNTYRGVQVLDVSDLSKPRVEGRLAVAGNPVEMYVVGERAFVLLNGWQGYYGTRDDLKVRAASGGLVMSVDIKDRANPKLIDQAEVSGDILTSRLTQGTDGQAALYVAATVYNNTDGQPHSRRQELSSQHRRARAQE